MSYHDQHMKEALDRIKQAKINGGKSVDLSGLDITEIPEELLVLAPTLEALYLRHTKITDAAPLEGLTNLTTLGLSNTQITDAAPLAGLTNLTTLNLRHTKITDAAPLEGLTNLTTLGLSNTQITDAAPLAGLTNLTELNLTDTQITDAAPLERLTNLTTLNLSDTPAASNRDNIPVFQAMQKRGCEIYGIEELMSNRAVTSAPTIDLKEMLRAVYTSGFLRSCEGFNAGHPFNDDKRRIEDALADGFDDCFQNVMVTIQTGGN